MFGDFSGDPVVRWINDPGRPDRTMELLEDFWYVDPERVRWDAPKGSVIDGASIPRVAWTIAGSPFTGDYRLASIVHDVACVERTRPFAAVHRMFYFACRANGLGEISAKIMYGAVRTFGPRWQPAAAKTVESASPAAVVPMQDQERFVAELGEEVRRSEGKMSLEAIDVSPVRLLARFVGLSAEQQRAQKGRCPVGGELLFFPSYFNPDGAAIPGGAFKWWSQLPRTAVGRCGRGHTWPVFAVRTHAAA